MNAEPLDGNGSDWTPTPLPPSTTTTPQGSNRSTRKPLPTILPVTATDCTIDTFLAILARAALEVAIAKVTGTVSGDDLPVEYALADITEHQRMIAFRDQEAGDTV